MRKPVVHETVPVRIWADIDIEVAPTVEYLNSILGVRTMSSCQGTLGEGGAEPYRAFVMAYWPEQMFDRLCAEFDVEPRGFNWGYVRPKGGHAHFINSRTSEGDVKP